MKNLFKIGLSTLVLLYSLNCSGLKHNLKVNNEIIRLKYDPIVAKRRIEVAQDKDSVMISLYNRTKQRIVQADYTMPFEFIISKEMLFQNSKSSYQFISYNNKGDVIEKGPPFVVVETDEVRNQLRKEAEVLKKKVEELKKLYKSREKERLEKEFKKKYNRT